MYDQHTETYLSQAVRARLPVIFGLPQTRVMVAPPLSGECQQYQATAPPRHDPHGLLPELLAHHGFNKFLPPPLLFGFHLHLICMYMRIFKFDVCRGDAPSPCACVHVRVYGRAANGAVDSHALALVCLRRHFSGREDHLVAFFQVCSVCGQNKRA